jgi:polysaccharide biosynthesis/export protein
MPKEGNIMRRTTQGMCVALMTLALAAGAARAQQPAEAVSPAAASPEHSAAQPTTLDSQLRSGYQLGPNDLIIIRALEVEEISDKPMRVDMNGDIRLPMIGRVHVTGLTPEQLEAALNARLKQFVTDPQVLVEVTEAHSQPVSVVGCVKNPGVYQLQGKKTLSDLLALAGGLREDAGNTVRITRAREWGKVPSSKVLEDPSAQVSVADIELKGLVEGANPEYNLLIMPNDVISVSRAQVVYVIGEVRKAGGFVLQDQQQISVSKAIAMAEGYNPTAKPGSSRILRVVPGSPERQQVALDVKRILDGKAKDVFLQPDDILYIPGSAVKRLTSTMITAAAQSAGLIALRY